MENENNGIERLFQKYIRNECNREEFDQLMQLLQDHVNEPLIEDFITRYLQEDDKVKLLVRQDRIQQSFQEVLDRIHAHEKQHTPVRKLIPVFYRVAAAVLIIIAVGTGLLRFTGIGETFEKLSYSIVEAKQVGQFSLADGTNVHINNHSTLKFPKSFKGKDARKVYLSGEAYFEVTKDPTKPFIINTEQSQIKVLGTAFNVKELNDTTVLVAVTEGKVTLSFVSDTEQKIILTPGMLGVLSGKTLSFRTLDNISNYLSWFKDNLVFNNGTLSSIVMQLEHIHNVKINVKDHALNDMRLTLKIKNYPVEQVLDEIAMALNLKINKKSGVYEISD